MRSKDLACPGCGETRHHQLEESTVAVSLDGKVEHSTYPVGYVVFACSCPVRIQPLLALVKLVGASLHAEIEADLLARRTADTETNRQREAREQQERIAKSERTARGWATGPVQKRIANFGSGYVVALPTLEDGITWDDLSQEVRITRDQGIVEATTEATRLNDEAAAQLAQRPAIEARMWADHAKREGEERRKRREAQSDVELSHPT